MSFNRPSLTEIDGRVKSDMQSNIDAVSVVGDRTVLSGISRGLSGASHELHGHAAYNFRQIFPDSSDIEQLERQAGFYGIARLQASRATGSVVVTGDDGTAIPSDTRLGAASGVEIATTEAGVIAEGSVTLAVQATTSGTAGNLVVDTGVSFLSPIAGASNVAQIAVPGMALGADIETKTALSDRVLERMRQVPHGGASFDYVRWAKEVPGVTRAWVAGNEMGLGTVTLRFAVDDSPTGPIPSDADVEAVETYIENRATADSVKEGRPVTAQLFVVAPIPAPVDIELTSTPDDDATRAAVRTELEALFRFSGVPGSVVSVGTISQAISLAPGLVSRTLIAPREDALPRLGYLPVLGDVTWL